MSEGRWQLDFKVTIGSKTNKASKNKSIVRGLAYHNKVYKLLSQHIELTAPEQRLYVEPWFRHSGTRKMRQPDAVLVDEMTRTAIVIEVKMNWKDGRDGTLLDVYLQAAKEAFNLEATWPALITSNVAGLKHRARLGLGALMGVVDWNPGDPTPVILVP